MNVKLRIATIRLYDKCQKNLDYSRKIGITGTIKKNKTRTTNMSEKGPD